MGYKSIPLPPPNFEGTLADWNALEPATQYYKSNQVRRAAHSKLWRQQNYTQIAAKEKIWRQKNKEQVSAFKKRWKKQNPVSVAASQHKRYIKKEREFYEMFGPMGVI